jgi:hypothetical protein
MIQLPPDIKDHAQKTNDGKAARAPLLAHLKRDLFHACFREMLDDEFINAYKNGIVVKCNDGVERRLFPCIFTYSADYPEKYVHFQLQLPLLISCPRVLIATIRDLGTYPCPRCLIPMKDVPLMGTVNDQRRRFNAARQDDHVRRFKVNLARQFIYRDGRPVNGKAVNDVLYSTSAVPTRVSPQRSPGYMHI